VFDTSFVHSAYNAAADAPADYLHVDFWHPDLDAAERRTLRVLRDEQARWRVPGIVHYTRHSGGP